MTKISLLKALVSANVSATAEILATLSETELKAVRNVFNQGYSDAKVLVTTAAAEQAAILAERAVERDNLVTKLMDEVHGMGLDLALASETADKAMAKKYPTENETKAPRYTFDKATVVVDGVEYTLPRSGNMSQELKNLVAAQGFEPTQRAEFITKFEKSEETDEVTE